MFSLSSKLLGQSERTAENQVNTYCFVLRAQSSSFEAQTLIVFLFTVCRHEEERRRREEEMMRHREQEDLRRHPDGFKPNYLDSVSTAETQTTH